MEGGTHLLQLHLGFWSWWLGFWGFQVAVEPTGKGADALGSRGQGLLVSGLMDLSFVLPLGVSSTCCLGGQPLTPLFKVLGLLRVYGQPLTPKQSPCSLCP
jgi:hypothetical protein